MVYRYEHFQLARAQCDRPKIEIQNQHTEPDLVARFVCALISLNENRTILRLDIQCGRVCEHQTGQSFGNESMISIHREFIQVNRCQTSFIFGHCHFGGLLQFVAIFDDQTDRSWFALVVHAHRNNVVGVRSNVLGRYDCVVSGMGNDILRNLINNRFERSRCYAQNAILIGIDFEQLFVLRSGVG